MKKKIRLIKKFRDTPLSKVYLVEMDGKKCIQKIIHTDFIKEFYKQKYLSSKCKLVKIPKIYNIKREGSKASALMEFIPHKKNKLKLKEVLDTISRFHKETENTRNNLFAIYDFDRFYKDFSVAKKYLSSNLKFMDKKQLKEFFKEIFNSKYSVIHGDFYEDQIFKNNGYYLIDFASSFYGPKILDYAYLFRYDKSIKKKVLEYLTEKNELSNEKLILKFLKSLVVILIYDISWLVNRRKYENKSFMVQISNDDLSISKNMKKIIANSNN